MASKLRRELWGWYSYAFASEVFAVCSLSLFLPICLEQFARDNAFLLPDRVLPCPKVGTSEDARCVVRLGWAWVDTASYSLYVFSASVAIQALTVISLGGLADDPRLRKSLLLTFATIGSISTFLFIALPSSSPIWPLSALLAVIANVSFGVSIVCLNAYLPQMARGDESVQALLADTDSTADNGVPISSGRDHSEDSEDVDFDENAPLRQAVGVDHVANGQSATQLAVYNEALSRATSRISSKGIAIGYAAGIGLLLLLLIPVTLLKGSTFSLRLAICLSGVWWGVFTIPSAIWLPGADTSRQRDNGSAEYETSSSSRSVSESVPRKILRAWRELGAMLRPSEVRRLPNTFWLLFAWFLLSDGFTTVTSTAILFAKTSLHMGATSLIIVGALAPSAGIVGAILWPRVQRYFGLTSMQSLVGLVFLALVIPVYGCLGFLPIFKGSPSSGAVSVNELRFGGLTRPGEMYVLAAYFGSVYGAFQGYARAVYSELIPKGQEARWYGLYSITDKSSSFVGPLVVGLIADATGNIRYAFFFLIFMIAVPIPILIRKVDVVAGRRDAQLHKRSVS